MKTLRSASIAPQKPGRRSQKGSSALRSSGTHSAWDSSAFDFTPSVVMRADTEVIMPGGKARLLCYKHVKLQYFLNAACVDLWGFIH